MGAAGGFRPLYAQVQTMLRDRIAAGGWSPGAMLPNEFELAAEYRVSQGTVRKALTALETERLIVRRQGRGTYVAEHTPQRALFHFFRIVDLDGTRLAPSSTVLDHGRGAATARQAALLGVTRGTALHAIKRVRSFNGQPTIFERIFVPTAIMPELAVARGPQHDEEMYVIYQRRWGVSIARATEHLAAVTASAEEARRLRLAAGAPLIEIRRVARDVAGRIVELRVSRVATADCRYAAEVY